MRRRGELSTRDVARRLEVHQRTVRRWAVAAYYGETSRLSPRAVRRDVGGRYWVAAGEVGRILSDDDRGHSEHATQTT